MNRNQAALHNTLSTLEHLDIDTVNYMVGMSRVLDVKKHSTFLHCDDIANRMYFVAEGLVMQRYDDGEKEKATSFHFEGDFVTSYESFLNQTPSEFYLRALEDSSLLYWEREDYERFLVERKNAVMASLSFVQTLFYQEFKAKSRLLAYPTEKLYNYLITEEPRLIQRVPLTYLAEYMGITNEYLSRIRRKLATQ